MRFSPILFVIVSLLLCSCSGELSKQTHEFKDARTGLVVNSAPYPGDWEVISRPLYTVDQKIPTFLVQIQGPDNLKSFNTPVKFHISYQNPQTIQFMRNSSTASMMRIEADTRALVQEEVVPRMQKSGYTYQSDRETPEVEEYIMQQLQGSGGNIQLDLLSTVWTNDSGQKAMASVTKISQAQPFMYGETMTLWYYSIQYLFVDEDEFEEVLEEMKESLLRTEQNPDWEQYMSALTQQRMQEATRQHQIRMQNRQAAFNAHQQRMKGISAAQDANFQSFMNRQFGEGSGSSQQRFLNMINEEETVQNPLTGESYQVDAGATQYWMDSDGNYIMNDDLFYTPNGDINLNNQEWVQVQPQ